MRLKIWTMINFNKTVLRVVTRLDNFYKYDVEVELIETGNHLNASYILKGGFAANILIQLSYYLNFSYEIIGDANKSLTYSFEEGSSLSIDLFAASYSLTKSRTAILDPTFVIGGSKIKVFFNHAFEASLQDFMLAPFQTAVWCMLGVIVLILSIAIGVSSIIVDGHNLGDATFQIVAVFIQRDGQIPFISLPSRVILWTTSFTSFLLYGAYSGTIISFLSVKKYFINTLDKIVSSNFDIGFNYGLNNGSSIEIAAQALNTTTIDGVFVKMMKSRFRFDTFEKSFEEVQNRPFAYIIDEATGYHTVETLLGYFPCKYGSVTFADISIPWVMYLRKGSEFRTAINYGIVKLRETGHIRYHMRRWLPGTGNRACESSGDGFASIQLHHAQTAFILLTVSILFAICFLIAEIAIDWKYGCRIDNLEKTQIATSINNETTM